MTEAAPERRTGKDARARPAAEHGSETHGSPGGEVRLQRSAGNQALAGLLDDDTRTPVDAVLASGGSALDESTRARMESALGSDFSGVRVHTDATAARSARELDAHAYTVGHSIVFEAGRYEPGTPRGDQLLAHELTHVVQQRAGPVDGSPIGGGVSVSDPHDRFERAAEASAAAVVSDVAARAVRESVLESAHLVPTSQPSTHPGSADAPRVVQRFAAGDTGHGHIEEEALTSAGFSMAEARSVYFGNWLRDMSQLPASLTPVVDLLSWGEFGHGFAAGDLGGYVPSEHLDNALGGGTVEDPTATPGQLNASYAGLSSAQRAALKDEDDHLRDIRTAAIVNGLPVYIERGKYHAKRMLEAAIDEPDVPTRQQYLGNALHAVEDYFAHSNFVEAAILILEREKVGGAKTTSLVARLEKTHLGRTAVAPYPIAGDPKIVTGTYAGSANSMVSLVHLLKTEIHHGELTWTLAKGLLRKGGIGLADLGRVVGGGAGAVVGGILGLAVGAGAGFVEGAASGLARAGPLGAAGMGLYGLARGAASGTRFGSALGMSAGRTVGWYLGQIEDRAAVLGIENVLLALGSLGLVANGSGFVRVIDGLIDAAAAVLTAQTRKTAPSPGPTHSELAKDSPDEELYEMAIHLAIEVDKQFGLAMQAAWSAKAAGTPLPPTTVTDLVDKYVSLPNRDRWWDGPLLSSIK